MIGILVTDFENNKTITISMNLNAEGNKKQQNVMLFDLPIERKEVLPLILRKSYNYFSTNPGYILKESLEYQTLRIKAKQLLKEQGIMVNDGSLTDIINILN